MSATLRLRGRTPATAWVPKRRSCDCGGSCGKCTANGGLGVMEHVRISPAPGSGRRRGAWIWDGDPRMSRAVQRDDDTGSSNTSYGPGELDHSRRYYAERQAGIAEMRAVTPPRRFEIPEGAATFCALDPGAEDCVGPVRDVAARDLEGLDLSGAVDSLDLIGFDALEEANLMHHAWAMLRDHMDVAEWIICTISGPLTSDQRQCLRRWSGSPSAERLTVRLVGRGRPTVFWRCESRWDAGVFVGSTIYVCGTSDSWSDTMRIWTEGITRSVDAWQVCAAIYVAALLLHELVHVCGIYGSDPRDELISECHDSYRIENSFRWAMGSLYPTSAVNSCCGRHNDEDLFNAVKINNLKLSCI